MKFLPKTSEHRPVACVPNAFVTRWIGSSGQQARWAHTLKVYVPICAFACMFWISAAFVQPDGDFAKANQEYSQGHFKEAIAGYESLVRAGQWNANLFYDLGNAYFRTEAYDQAIDAFKRAIELNPRFGWPYSNLALAYVQKARFAEAILLYQRSIELFTGDKDKAISWNRLGNVYRRLNDYENAIFAYQRADDLDPDNTTLSLQSRFSLLGSYALEPKPSYVS